MKSIQQIGSEVSQYNFIMLNPDIHQLTFTASTSLVIIKCNGQLVQYN